MALSLLKSLASEVEEPDDYFMGVEPIPQVHPTNVIQFVRRGTSHFGPTGTPAVHRRFVLITNLQTSGYVILDGSAIPLHEGEGILIFPFQAHHYAQLSKEERACWLFTTFEHENPKELEALRETPFSYEERDIERLTRLTTLLKERSAGYGKGAAAPYELALLLSGLLQRRQRYLSSTGGLRNSELPSIDFLQAVTLYIHRNLNRPVTAEEIASEVNLSVSRLRSKFSQITGVSLGRYIRETRMHKARGLLNSTNLNVTQISESCGFDSLFSFSRAFRNANGLPPREFRRNIKR